MSKHHDHKHNESNGDAKKDAEVVTQKNPAPQDDAALAKAQQKKDAEAKKEQERLRKQAEREQKNATAAAEREAKKQAAQAEREAKNAEAQVKRDAEKEERRLKREADAKERAEKRATESEATKAQREAEKQARKDQRAADREAKKEAGKAESEAKKAARKQQAEQRAAAIAARKEQVKIDGARRPKATHIVYNGSGLSSPQTSSIRGKVLEYIKDHCPVGEKYPIDALAEETKPLLYGTNVRSYLSKLEEMGHLDFVVVEPKPDETPQPELAPEQPQPQ